MNADIAAQTAWRAYYETLRDHPQATPEQRERACSMLGRKPLYEKATLAERKPEDFA